MTLQKKLLIGTALVGGIGLLATFILIQTLDSFLFEEDWDIDFDYSIK